MAETGEQGRQMGIFGAPVPVAADAPALDRALGLSGRDPGWAPAAAGWPIGTLGLTVNVTRAWPPRRRRYPGAVTR